HGHRTSTYAHINNTDQLILYVLRKTPEGTIYTRLEGLIENSLIAHRWLVSNTEAQRMATHDQFGTQVQAGSDSAVTNVDSYIIPNHYPVQFAVSHFETADDVLNSAWGLRSRGGSDRQMLDLTGEPKQGIEEK
ncbi:hypothetical protein HK102_011189, partial [Quaeritorhiza haematococci]